MTMDDSQQGMRLRLHPSTLSAHVQHKRHPISFHWCTSLTSQAHEIAERHEDFAGPHTSYGKQVPRA